MNSCSKVFVKEIQMKRVCKLCHVCSRQIYVGAESCVVTPEHSLHHNDVVVCLVFKCKTTTGALTGSPLAVGRHENPLLSYALSRSKFSADWSAFNISHMLQ